MKKNQLNTLSFKRSATILIITTLLSVSFPQVYASESILPQSLVVSLQVEEVFEYRCPGSSQCEIRCSSGVSEEVSYKNVRRAEIARSKGYWLFGAVYIDSLGKGHKATGFLPQPASCILDDLDFVNRVPVVDGAFSREPDEVIFELSPSN